MDVGESKSAESTQPESSGACSRVAGGGNSKEAGGEGDLIGGDIELL